MCFLLMCKLAAVRPIDTRCPSVGGAQCMQQCFIEFSDGTPFVAETISVPFVPVFQVHQGRFLIFCVVMGAWLGRMKFINAFWLGGIKFNFD